MLTVPISQITIGSNRRPIKEQKLAELMDSIQLNGLLNPITIDHTYRLIAGLHRLTACKLLGFKEIECHILPQDNTVHARLAEIDENLIRSELDALERAELWLERDQLLTSLGMRSSSGDNQYKRQGGEIISPPRKTTLELAQETGYTERTFQQGKQIAKALVPEVKEAIRGTPLAKSPTALLKVARAGSKERKQVEAAEQALKAAQAQQNQAEIEQQVQAIAEATSKLRESQLSALQSITTEKQAKQQRKKNQAKSRPPASYMPPEQFDVHPGDEYLLDHHLICCLDTASAVFIDRLPSSAALAISTLSPTWEHNYLIQEAQVVAVLRAEGTIHEFYRQQQMPFQFEFLLGDIYLAVFSRRPLSKPAKPIELNNLEGIVAYLINLFTQPGNFVIAPFAGNGEVLITCEKLGRVCFAGDADPEQVKQSITRWQNWTGKKAKKALSNHSEQSSHCPQ